MNMKLKFFLIFSSIIFLSVMIACTKYLWKYYPADNLIEEIIEEVIESETGLDIDLTPLSPEDNSNGNK